MSTILTARTAGQAPAAERETENEEVIWKSVYRAGGAAALLAVLVTLSEIAITFLPGGNASPETIDGWFTLFQDNWFLGLRNLGLLNLAFTTLALLVFFALYGAHRHANRPYAALALILFILGGAVFCATNRAFPMLALSRQYAVATTGPQRATVMAAAQAMLAVGQSHTPGTFLGFFLSEAAGLVMALVMLRSRIFGSATAYAGISAFGFLLVFEVCASFVPALGAVAMLFAMVGGLSSIVWYLLAARRLFQLGQRAPERRLHPSSSRIGAH